MCVYASHALFFFKQKPAYEMSISDWSSDVCSSDLKAGTVMHSVIRFSAILFAALSALTLGSCSDDKETGPVAVSIAGLPDDLAHPLSRQQRPAAQLMIGATGQGDRKSTRLNSSH